MTIQKNYQRWLNSPKVDEKTKEVLKNLSQEEIDDAFFKDAEFGTAGLRGVLGPGTNRLNNFTVRKVTIGFAKYLLEKYPNAKKEGVVISHDNRFFSREFTLLTAQILNDFGINTYIFDSLRPTPELSFAVRYCKACGGVMITASHNPKEYNGYKVYDETGCQLVPSKIERLVEIISLLPNELDVDYIKDETPGNNVVLGNEIDDEYVKLVESIAINKDLDKSNFKIVYTPNHGTSFVNAMRIFKDFGYQIYPVLSQCEPDPNFSGTLSPNPEDQRSYIEPIKLAKQVNAQLVVMTDPDGDRVGLAYLGKDNEYHTLNGNQSAVMLMDYIFDMRQKNGTLSNNGVMYNTIVTSPLGKKVAAYYGVKTEQFLTGFKFIGNRIDYYEKNGGPKFEFGYEESYGCLIAPFARDKDGLQAILLYCEMALYHFLNGKSLDVVFDEIGYKYGFYQDIVYPFEFYGPSGQAKMDNLMKTLHQNPFLDIGGNKVVAVDDILLSKHIENGQESDINLPKSDVVKLYFADGSVICVRPSGTEPKVKFYISVNSTEKPFNKDKPDLLCNKLKEILDM